MGDKGKRDIGKREQQKKAKLTPKQKRKLKRERRNKCAVLSGDLESSTEVVRPGTSVANDGLRKRCN